MKRRLILEFTCFGVFALWLGLNLYGIIFHNFLISTDIIHLLGGFGAAFVLHKILERYLLKRKLALTLIEKEVLIFSAVTTLGVFDEIVDLLFDYLTKKPVLGGRQDTALDLLMNTTGILLFLFLKRIFKYKL